MSRDIKFVDCLAHDPALVNHAVAVFGEERLVLGSDWPFAIGTDHPRGQVAHCGAAFVELVASENAARALGHHENRRSMSRAVWILGDNPQ